MNTITEKNALLTYTKDKTMHVQSTTSTNNYRTSEGSTTPNTKNLERVWSPNKFNQKKPELLTLALDNPLKISWSCLKQTSTSMEQNKTTIKHFNPSPPSPTSSTTSSSSYSDNSQQPLRNMTPSTAPSAMSNTLDDATSPTIAGNDPLSPTHHARRPMNAFLIFCKKHRPVVRRKFLTLENRAVTKILGEWWALLEVGEKDAYTTLAREFKDAFFNANPDFKWYKLPAPPLRTLHTRPSTNHPREHCQLSPFSPNVTTTATIATMAGILSQGQHNTTSSTATTTGSSSSPIEKEKGGNVVVVGGSNNKDGGNRVEFTPGKLADESQLGKLSSLLNMSSNHIMHIENSNYCSYNNNNYDTEKNNNNANYMSISDGNSIVTTPLSMQDDDHTPMKPIKKRELLTNDQNDNSDGRLFDTSDGSRVARNLFDDDDTEGSEEPKVGRKCKGKRYKEFMINGKLLKNKRDKLSEDDGEEPSQMDSNSQDNSFARGGAHHIDLDTTIKMLAERTHTKLPESTGNNNKHQSDNNSASSEYVSAVATSPNNNGSSAFNLDDKIAMLPCLSYDQYVRRKRDSKKRSKFVRNRELTGKTKMKSAAAATLTPSASVVGLVGSKKRKNKQNITHLKGKVAKECGMMVKENRSKEVNVAPDMFGLATLAEIAANTEKLNQ